MADDDSRHAYVRATRDFPTLAALGVGEPPALWMEAIRKIDPTAFDAVLATGMTVEGGNLNGQLNFDQKLRIQALYARRAELDPTFSNPYTQPLPPMRERQSMSVTVRL